MDKASIRAACERASGKRVLRICVEPVQSLTDSYLVKAQFADGSTVKTYLLAGYSGQNQGWIASNLIELGYPEDPLPAAAYPSRQRPVAV